MSGAASPLPACMRVVVLARLMASSRVLLGSRNGMERPCVLWTGAQSRGGRRPSSGPYGSVWVPGVGGIRVHVASAWIFGLIGGLRVPPGMNIDHVCERTLCFEPSHLKIIPASENQQLRWQRRQRARHSATPRHMHAPTREEQPCSTR